MRTLRTGITAILLTTAGACGQSGAGPGQDAGTASDANAARDGRAVDGGALDAGALPDGDRSDAALVNGVVVHALRDLCFPLAGASVRVLDGTVQATTDRSGNATLDGVPASASLLLQASGYVDTLTSVRALTTGAKVTALGTANFYYGAAYLLSGIAPDATRGAAVVSLINDAALPIAGVTVDLAGGGTDTGVRRYVGAAGADAGATLGGSLTFDPTTADSQPSVGAVVFLNVPPGTYQVVATRGSDTFPPMSMVVRAGMVTADDLVRPGSGGTAPTPVTGTILAGPLLPAEGAAAPAPGLAVVVHDVARNVDVPATTDDAGVYSLLLPAGRTTVDINFAHAPYTSIRSFEFCAGPPALPMDWEVDDPHWYAATFAPAVDGVPLDPTRGTVAVAVENSAASAGYAGATVAIDPPAATPYYTPVSPPPCVVAAACPAGGCPANSRCESGACVLGAASPTCSLSPCASAPPAGYATYGFVEQGTAVCRTLPTRPDCASSTSTCDPGMYCAVSTQETTPNTFVLGTPACVPLAPSAGATLVDTSGQPDRVVFPNLPPAEYDFQAPGRTLGPMTVRVSAGSVIIFGLYMR